MVEDIIKENILRNKRLKHKYDPIAGIGCYGKRVRQRLSSGTVYLLEDMTKSADYKKVNDKIEFDLLRFKYDFEYWAAKCVKIKDKTTGKNISFILNGPQRKLLSVLEDDRTAGKPCRIIMLKARQWGGSTLVQIYMAWLQIIVSPGRNSLICAQVKDTAATIRGMYSKLLELYPTEYLPSDKPMKFTPFEGSANTRQITEAGCKVTIGSSERQDSVRGADYSLAHLSEVAFWRSTPGSTPQNFIRSICGAINQTPGTLIVYESTANGVGNFFHQEWLRAKEGKSDKKPVFVPWYEIEIYRSPVKDAEALWKSLTEYEKNLWNVYGLTLEMIQWYHNKCLEYPSHELMQAEYPTNSVEAFTKTGNNVFDINKIEVLRKNCREAVYTGEVTGLKHRGKDAITDVHFTEDKTGKLKVWKKPESGGTISQRYVVSVDIGGRSGKSDYSVIAVIDREGLVNGFGPEVVAQWRGHDDHDIIAWRAAAIATYYDNALLVIESNTLDCDNIGGDPAESILTEISNSYHNLYFRKGLEGETHIGFHTNRATKSMIINRLIALIRDNEYVERDNEACNELAVYEQKGTTFGAIDGNHDDIVMARAIGLFVSTELPVDTRQNYKVFDKESKPDSSQYSIFKSSEVM